MYTNSPIKLALVALLAIGTQACLPPAKVATPAPKAKQAQFIDSYVSNIRYAATPSGKNGVTDEFGYFNYSEGDTVVFSIGGINLPGIKPTKSVLTPYDLAGSGSDEVATNIAVLLQTLDDDGNAENGIQISAQTHTDAEGATLDVSTDSSSFTSSFTTLLETEITTKAASDLVDLVEAQAHMNATIANQFKVTELRVQGENIYIDANGNGIQDYETEPTTGFESVTKAVNLTLIKAPFVPADIEDKKLALLLFMADYFDTDESNYYLSSYSLLASSTWDTDNYMQFNADLSLQFGSFNRGELCCGEDSAWSISDGSLEMFQEDAYGENTTLIRATRVSGLPDRDNAILYEVWMDPDSTTAPNLATIAATEQPVFRVLGDLRQVTGSPHTFLSSATALAEQSVNKGEYKSYRLAQSDIDSCSNPLQLTFSVTPASGADNPLVRALVNGPMEYYLMRIDLSADVGGCEGSEAHPNCSSDEYNWPWPYNLYADNTSAGVTDSATINIMSNTWPHYIVVEGNDASGATEFSIEASCTP